MSDRERRCAILGASGYVGQHFARLLARHPMFSLPQLIGSDRSAGRTLAEVWRLEEPPPVDLAQQRIERRTVSQIAREGFDLVFSALPSGTAGSIETELARHGVCVFTNAADHRMDAGVPLLVPEVNSAHLGLLATRPAARGLIIANPNCSTTGLVLALASILGTLAPRRIQVTTYQARSGAGILGLDSARITNNVVPYIEKEEEKIESESQRILGRLMHGLVRPLALPFFAQCARVDVRDGHLEAVTVEARRRPTLREILRAWKEFDPLIDRNLPTAPHPPILVRSESDRPQPRLDSWAGTPARARGMAVVVGRPRWTPPFLRFFLLSHNAVRGGAGGSILNAELACEQGWLGASSEGSEE
ncbi:MAG: aspartate-semialdehyde dehydrogenase [Thermoplasmata archaeon]